MAAFAAPVLEALEHLEVAMRRMPPAEPVQQGHTPVRCPQMLRHEIKVAQDGLPDVVRGAHQDIAPRQVQVVQADLRGGFDQLPQGRQGIVRHAALALGKFEQRGAVDKFLQEGCRAVAATRHAQRPGHERPQRFMGIERGVPLVLELGQAVRMAPLEFARGFRPVEFNRQIALPLARKEDLRAASFAQGPDERDSGQLAICKHVTIHEERFSCWPRSAIAPGSGSLLGLSTAMFRHGERFPARRCTRAGGDGQERVFPRC